MKEFNRKVGTVLLSLGFDPRRLAYSIMFLPRFLLSFLKVCSLFLKHGKQALEGQRFKLSLVPILSDKHMPSGVAKGHYFHQDLWAARKIFEAHPENHIDVGSRIDGFIAHLLCFRSVTVIDIRSLESKIEGLTFHKADLTSSDSVKITANSVSCLHALEHFGLGRYGDPLDLDGWLKGFSGLAKMVDKGGLLYISVPIGRVQRIEFNAQRIFDPNTLPLAAGALGLELEEFSWITDAGDMIRKASLDGADCSFGCGCYVFKKV